MPTQLITQLARTMTAVSIAALSFSAPARAAKPRACVISVNVEPLDDDAAKLLRDKLEGAVGSSRGLTLVDFSTVLETASKKQLPVEQLTMAQHLYDLSVTLDLDVALMVWSAPYSDRFRLVLAAVDPLDGRALAKASLKTGAATPTKAALRKLVRSLVKEIKKNRAQDQAEAPPPPPVP